MARKVVWTRSAADDFESAADFLRQDSPSYAALFTQEIREASRSLTSLAERGRVVAELGESHFREIFVHSYRVIYRVRPKQITVLAVIHGRRDLHSAWGKRNRQ